MPDERAPLWLRPESEMGRRIAAKDWASTPLGALEAWPGALRVALAIMLEEPRPMAIYWGPEHRFFYNDAAIVLIGDRHPDALGVPGEQAFSDAWVRKAAAIESVEEELRSKRARRLPWRLERDGRSEERWFDFSWTPLILEDGQSGGVIVLATDVTETVRAEAERDAALAQVRDDEVRYRRLFDLSVDLQGIASVPERRWLLVNPSMSRTLGWSREELLTRDMTDFIHPDDRARTREVVAALGRGERIPDFEQRMLCSDGTHRWIAWSAAPEPTEGLLFCSGRDVTVHHEAEQARRAQNERLRRLADASPAILWVTDSRGRSVYLSKSWYDLTGQAPGEGMGLGWLEAIHPDDRARTREVYRAATKAREAFRLDYRVRTAEGDYRWAMDAGRPWLGSDGEVMGYAGTVIDVHDRKELEEARRISEERYATLFSTIDEGFCVLEMEFDEDGTPVDYRWVEVNPAFESQTGLAGALGQRARTLLPNLEQRWFDRLGGVATTLESRSASLTARRPSGVSSMSTRSRSAPRISIVSACCSGTSPRPRSPRRRSVRARRAWRPSWRRRRPTST